MLSTVHSGVLIGITPNMNCNIKLAGVLIVCFRFILSIGEKMDDHCSLGGAIEKYFQCKQDTYFGWKNYDCVSQTKKPFIESKYEGTTTNTKKYKNEVKSEISSKEQQNIENVENMESAAVKPFIGDWQTETRLKSGDLEYNLDVILSCIQNDYSIKRMVASEIDGSIDSKSSYPGLSEDLEEQHISLL